MTMSVNDTRQGPSNSEKNKTEHSLDLKKLTKPQLLELLERQNKLISSSALNKLRDKGEKVKLLKQQIEEELAKRNVSVDICDELNKLSINGKKIEEIEWGEKAGSDFEHNGSNRDRDILDVEKDPLAIIATHSGTVYNQRKIIKGEEDEPLVTLADIEEAYALNLCNKIDKAEHKQRFLPHKTLNKTRAVNKTRDLSAATPPAPVFGDTKLITLEESIKLQYEQTQHLKEVQLKHATERLRDLNKYKMGSSLPVGDSIMTYREQMYEYKEEESADEYEEEE